MIEIDKKSAFIRLLSVSIIEPKQSLGEKSIEYFGQCSLDDAARESPAFVGGTTHGLSRAVYRLSVKQTWIMCKELPQDCQKDPFRAATLHEA